MKAEFSSYLNGIAPGLARLIALLDDFDYASVLAADSVGFAVRVSQKNMSVENRTMTTERGIVIRLGKDGLYTEYALNRFDPEHPEETAAAARRAREAQIAVLRAAGAEIYETGILADEPLTIDAAYDTEETPEGTDQEALLAALRRISDEGMSLSENLVDVRLTAQTTHISKIFLTKNRNLRQTYVYSEAMVMPIAAKDGKMVVAPESLSGRVGPELFKELSGKLASAVKTAEELLSADRLEPGEYDIIAAPDIAGLIAHEAFGHGVEMDMFVKGRALGADYIGKRVGSDLVTMHEGALCATNVTTYAFDDEGTLAGDVVEIDRGILRTGICDALSALRLGVQPTGNGKRQNCEHKVYTRMTNTVFDSGESTLEEMIASIDFGYLLEGTQSGMEDPKHWGIQCLVERGYEIRDGKLTGKVVAPVVMTGYVPELLGSISMLSRDRKVFGSGGCGKGYKEWVKVADGGPYLKAKARLG